MKWQLLNFHPIRTRICSRVMVKWKGNSLERKYYKQQGQLIGWMSAILQMKTAKKKKSHLFEFMRYCQSCQTTYFSAQFECIAHGYCLCRMLFKQDLAKRFAYVYLTNKALQLPGEKILLKNKLRIFQKAINEFFVKKL